MRLISKNYNGNIHDAVEFVNKLGLARFSFNFVSISGNNSIIIYKVESYQEYLWFCKKYNDEPIPCQLF